MTNTVKYTKVAGQVTTASTSYAFLPEEKQNIKAVGGAVTTIGRGIDAAGDSIASDVATAVDEALKTERSCRRFPVKSWHRAPARQSQCWDASDRGAIGARRMA